MNKPNVAAAVALFGILVGGVTTASAQNRVSPHETISAHIGNARSGPLVTITYGRPYAKNPRGGEVRKVWGTLGPWGKGWRLGSDEATILPTQAIANTHDVTTSILFPRAFLAGPELHQCRRADEQSQLRRRATRAGGHSAGPQKLPADGHCSDGGGASG